MFRVRQCQVKYETEIFSKKNRLGIMGLVEGRERGVDYFTGLLRETNEKEISFRGIESKIIRRHSG